MTISINRNREDPYTRIPNEIIEDEGIKAECLGVLVYLVGKPHNWQVMPAQLAKRFGCGKDKIYRILNNLIASGYVTRDQHHKSDGSFSEYHYTVHDEKQSPRRENPDTANPLTANPPLLKKESTKETLELRPSPQKQRRCTLPKEFPMTDRHIQYAASSGLMQPYAATIFENFKNHHAAKGTLMIDWDAAWRKWVGNEIKFSAARTTPTKAQNGKGVYGDDWW